MATVASIAIAPVKGLALVRRDDVQLDTSGVRDNRRFYLIDADGRMINGKRLGRLVQVVPVYDDAVGTLELRFPDGQVVAGDVAVDGTVTTEFYGRPVAGEVVRGPWAEALSEWACRPLALVRTAEPGTGVDRGATAGVTIASLASLDALAGAAGVDAVDGRRFRMLFMVDGVRAHGEDAWLDRRIEIGDAVVVGRGQVGRCAVTTQNPDTGVPDLDTLRFIKQYRAEAEVDAPIPFGVWAEVVRPGRVRVGDPLREL